MKAKQVFKFSSYKNIGKIASEILFSHEKVFYGYILNTTGPSYCANSTLCIWEKVCEPWSVWWKPMHKWEVWANREPKEKIICRRSCICYWVSCFLCLEAGRPAVITSYLQSPCYYGQSAKNTHRRVKEHVSMSNSKSGKIQAESAFFKHLMSCHGGKSDNKSFSDYFEM